MLKSIVVHGGACHLDEVIASALVLCRHGEGLLEESDGSFAVPIYRRDPTPEELDDPEVAVLDVGGRHDPDKLDFDHHQRGRSEEPKSAMMLVAEALTVPNGEPFVDTFAEILPKLFPWFVTRNRLDVTGPFATAKAMGVEWDVVKAFLGPLEDMFLDAWAAAEPVSRGITTLAVADYIDVRLEAYDVVASAVKVDRPWWADRQFAIRDFTSADPEKTELVSSAVLGDADGVAIFHDDRGPGLALLRLKDDPRIDFTKVKDDPEVAFAHQGGFIAKTRSKDLEKAWRLIEDAYIGK